MAGFAEQKYNLLLVNNNADKKVHPQPWWKERITMKVCGDNDNSRRSRLKASDWTFLEPGSDDFRPRQPSQSEKTKSTSSKGISVNITKSTATRPARPRRQRPSASAVAAAKYENVFSKEIPGQGSRRRAVEEIENGLLNHKLALYPHLEQSLPPNMFEEVIDYVDPEMHLVDEYEGTQELIDPYFTPCMETPATLVVDQQIESETELDRINRENNEEVARFYRALLYHVMGFDKGDPVRTALSPAEDAHIKEVTQEFCNWVGDLGGETNNIEESTINSLFASGYETKPALSSSIHVVELSSIPPELRIGSASTTVTSQDQLQAKPADPSSASSKNVKYGAWYIPTKQWKKMAIDEAFEDPSSNKEELSDVKKQSNKLDQVLTSMHGAAAFQEFIERKAGRCPGFLSSISDLKAQAAKISNSKINHSA